jgi:hypothetical protein
MKTMMALIVSLAATACATGGQEGGIATYDALQRMQADCAARGMTLRLKTEGAAQSVDAYACERK